MIRLITPYFITFFLVICAYFFVEKPEYEKIVKQNKERFPLRSIVVESIQLNKVSLIYNSHKKKWDEKSNRYEIDQEKVNSFLKRLKKLSFERAINTEELRMNFNDSFTFRFEW